MDASRLTPTGMPDNKAKKTETAPLFVNNLPMNMIIPQ